MPFPSRHILTVFLALSSAVSAGAVGTSESWPFDQRQILLVATDGLNFPDSLTTAQIMDVFARRGRVRWVTQKGGAGQVMPVMAPRDFPWHSSVAVRQLGLRYKSDGMVVLSQKGVLVDLRWYATVDGQPLFFESVSLPDAGPRPGEEGIRKQRLLDWLSEMWARIPGRGYVVKRDLTTVTLEGAGQEGVKVGDRVEIRRLQQIKRHPLLKTLVGIESSASGTAIVTAVGDPLATARIEYESPADPIQEGDRYAPMPGAAAPSVAPGSAPTASLPPGEAAPTGVVTSLISDNGFSHFLDLTGRLLLGRLNHQETAQDKAEALEAGSLAPGVEIQAKVYLTREWLLGADTAFAFLNFKDLEAADFGAESSSGEYSNFRFYGGYRSIFLESDQGQGEFEVQVGFRRAGLSFSPLAAATSPTSKTFGGLDVGFGVGVPVDAGVGIFFRADRMFGSALTETPETGGALSASVVWNFEGGLKYALNPTAELTGGLSFFRASATYEGSGTRATPSLSTLVSGTLFNAGYTHKF